MSASFHFTRDTVLAEGVVSEPTFAASERGFLANRLLTFAAAAFLMPFTLITELHAAVTVAVPAARTDSVTPAAPWNPTSMPIQPDPYYLPKGDCKTDDTAALQSMLNARRWLSLDRPKGGCYLISKTLILYPGDYLYGLSANNPNNDGSQGVVIKLAPNSNVSALRTSYSNLPPGNGNEFMAVENIVFDGNGAEQTTELRGAALVDYRGTFVQTFLRHVMITNAFGPGLFTGSTELDNVWIIGCTTSTYSWIHNPYPKPDYGALLVNQVYVEESLKPAGNRYSSPWQKNSAYDPSQFSHGIWFNGLSSATINQLHCESVATCLDINDVQSLTINGITGDRIGDPTSADPTDQYLIRARNTNIFGLTFTAAYFDQVGLQYPGGLPNSRVFGLGNGVSSHDIYQTPVGKTAWPFYTWGRIDQSHTAGPFIGEDPVAANEMFIQRLGGYSPNRVAIFGNSGEVPYTDYSYMERNGSQLNFGFSPGPLNVNEEHMLQLNFFGFQNPANNVRVLEGTLGSGNSGNTDLVGELSLQGTTSVQYNFAHQYANHPECAVMPQFDAGPDNRLWITYSGASAFTVNSTHPVTGVASYTCLARD